MNKTKKNHDAQFSAGEIQAVLEGYATTKPAVNPTLTRPEGWKALAMIALLARHNPLFSQYTDATLEMIVSGQLDGAAIYRKVFGADVVAPSAGVEDIDLCQFEHVKEGPSRPRDTGERTPLGHRVIERSDGKQRSIEAPFNSGQLVSPEIYDQWVTDRIARNAQDIFQRLKAWIEFARAAGLDANNPLYEQSEAVAREAQGL